MVEDGSIFPGLSDLSKKKSNLQLLDGGLAERTLKLVQKEHSEMLLWQHKVEQDTREEYGELFYLKQVHCMLAK